MPVVAGNVTQVFVLREPSLSLQDQIQVQRTMGLLKPTPLSISQKLVPADALHTPVSAERTACSVVLPPPTPPLLEEMSCFLEFQVPGPHLATAGSFLFCIAVLLGS